MNARMLVGLVAFTFLLAATTNPSNAQGNALAVTIARPSEGEIIYSGPGAPYVCVPVTGWVTTAGYATSGKLGKPMSEGFLGLYMPGS